MLISKFNWVENASQILQAKVQEVIPKDYLIFLDKYNGGLTPKTEVDVGGSKDDIRAFFGIDAENKLYSFHRLEKNGRMEEFLSQKYLPVASNSGGDYYAISLTEKNYGQVFLFYHDLADKKAFVADTFSDFINQATSQEIGNIRTMEEREATAIANGYGAKIEKLRPIWQKEIDKFSHITQEEVIL